MDRYICVGRSDMRLTNETPAEVICDIITPERINDLFNDYQYGILTTRGPIITRRMVDLAQILINFTHMKLNVFRIWLNNAIGQRATKTIIPNNIIRYRIRDIFYLALSCPNVIVESDDAFLAIFLSLAIQRSIYEPSNINQLVADWERFKMESFERLLERGISRGKASAMLMDYYRTKFLYYYFETINIIKQSYTHIIPFEIFLATQLLISY